MKTIIIVLLLITTLKVVSSCYNHNRTIEAEQRTREYVLPRIDRPERCAQYLNDGTDRWINCMGVEKR